MRAISRFPEFVFSWMYNFQYDMKKTRITLLNEFDPGTVYNLWQFIVNYHDKLWVLYY